MNLKATELSLTYIASPEWRKKKYTAEKDALEAEEGAGQLGF